MTNSNQKPYDSWLYIAEYNRLTLDYAGALVPSAPLVPPVRDQRLGIDFEPQVSEPFDEKTKFIDVVADLDCCLAFGPEPKADARLHKIRAGETRRYGVSPGHRLAVVAAED